MSQIAAQVEDRLPGTRTVIVKYGLDHRAARSLPRTRVWKMIREASQLAVQGPRPEVRALVGPVTFRLEFTRSFYAEIAALMPSVKRIDGRTIEVQGRDVIEAWRWASTALRLGSTGDN